MSELVGQTLGKYRIVARLGAGGMAEVYKAYQPGLDRHVAIKIMKSHVASQKGSARRFEREAVAVARLRHPNIVQVHDFDAHGDTRYMVMEFVEGPTLRSELEERQHQNQPFSIAEVARIFIALTSAIDYAHAQNIIHHDLKPDNVMITPTGQVVLTDFGIARLMDAAHQTDTDLVAGTPAYMAPEQGQGELGDRRSDIYSLGVILYELATGQVPFTGESALSIIVQHIKEPPPPPSTINTTVPKPVEEIILKALSKNAEERYQTAGELGVQLWQAAGVMADQAQQPSAALINAVAAAPQLQEVVLTPDRPPLSDSAPIPPCPYRGLFAFQEEDAPFFFGREAFTAQLIEAVHRQSLVAVLGPSGSGKSSVVFAGLIPRLRQETTTASTESEMYNWHIATFRPGDQPFRSLAAALLSQMEPALDESNQPKEVNKLATGLQQGQTSLPEVAAQIIRQQSQNNGGARLLLVIDQFEELYTLCTGPQTRRRFLNELLAAMDAARGYVPGQQLDLPAGVRQLPLSIVLTMRADFLGQALTHRAFADALQAADVKLGPMTRQELERAIENPAGRQGVLFEKGLAARILDDVGEEPGRLPLLEFALTSLWDRQTGGLLTHDAYEASGRVEGALAHYAGEVYAKLSQAQQAQARRLFIQLVRPGEGTEDTRRIATRDELGQANWTLAQKLADARLVVTGRNSGGQETAEVVHEALIRGWQQLRDWMRADRTFRAWQERLRQALQQWEASKRDEGALLRGVLLAEAEGWLAERKHDLSLAEQEFIQASIAQRQQRQAAQERQRRRIMMGLATGLGLTIIGLVVVVILLIVAGIGWQQAGEAADRAEAQRQEAEAQRQEAETQRQEAEAQRQAAEEQRRAALARQLIAQGMEQAANQPDLSLLLSLEADQIGPGLNLETQRSLLTALETNPHLVTYLRGHLGDVQSVAFSPDGKTVASASDGDDIIILWDVETRRPVGAPLAGHTDSVNSLAFSPDGKILASGSDDQTIMLWDAKTGEPIGQPLAGHTSWVKFVAFSPNGDMLASSGGDKRVILWDVDTGRQLGQLTGHTDAIRTVAFSPTSSTLASGSDDETIILWDVDSQQPLAPPLTGHTDWVNSLAFSPDGRTLASGSRDGSIILWNLTSRPYQRRDRPLTGHTNSVLSLAFSPDGQTLASGSWDKTIILWDVATRQPIGQPLTGHTNWVGSVAFSPNGQMLASGSSDNTVILWDLSGRQRLAEPLAEQPAGVRSVAFSPDGRQLASASADESIILWNLSLGTPSGVSLKEHTGQVLSAAFSPDGEILASGSSDDTVILWDIDNRQPIGQPLTGHTDWVNSVAFSPNGEILASGSDDGTIILWDVGNRQALGAPLTGHTDWVRSVKFSPDGQTLASASRDGTVILWDVDTRQRIGPPLAAHTDWVLALAFSPNGQILASGSRDTTIILWDVSDRNNPTQLGLPLTGHTDTVLDLAFSPNGQTLASGSWDESIILWDVDSRQPLGPPLSGHTNPVRSVMFSPNGQTLASGSEDGTVVFWNPKTGQQQGDPLTGHRRAVRSVAFSPDGQTLAWGSEDETITLWDMAAGKRIGQPLTGHTDWVNSLAFSPVTNLLASGDGDGQIILWDAATGQALGEPITAHTDWIGSVAFSPDGNILASGGGDKAVRLWDVSSDSIQMRGQLSGHTGDVEEITFSPDGTILASGSDDESIILWDVEEGRRLGQLTGHTDWVNGVAFSPDGKILASGSTDNTIILWDVNSLQPLGPPLTGHSSWVESVAFSPDGTKLASAGGDNRIILWDVATGQQLGPSLMGHTAEVQELAFSPDGRVLVSGGNDGAIIRWDVSLESWKERACRVAARNLTWGEWQQYLGSESYHPTCPGQPLYLSEIYRQADIYAQAGQLQQARDTFEQAVQMALKTDVGALNNNICWQGSLNKLAEIVLPACEYAVEIAAESEKGYFRDSRGVARALTGDYEGAIEDFEYFMDWSRKYGVQSQLRIKRHAWINALKEGQNPFDDATLNELRTE